MDRPELVLSARQPTWRLSRKDHSLVAAVGKLVHERGRYVCVYCGARTLQAHDVLHVDDDHGNAAEQNLACVCPLCHQLFHLGCVADEDRGSVIYAPEFSQAQINALTVAVWLALDAGGAWAQVAKTIYDDLQGRTCFASAVVRQWAQEAKVQFQDPFVLSVELLGRVLTGLPPEVYRQRKELLGGLRLLPKREPFAAEVAQWQLHYSHALPPSDWCKLHFSAEAKEADTDNSG